MSEIPPVLNSCFELGPDNPSWVSSAEQWGGNGNRAIVLSSPQTHTKWDPCCVSVIDMCEYKAEKFLALNWILP